MFVLPSNAIVTHIVPRVSETDGCGHINNTTLPVWFEAGRREIIRAITPDLSFQNWFVAVVSMRVDFMAQTYLDADVQIHSWVSKLGNKSIVVREAATQQGRRCADGECAYVYFDYRKEQSLPIPDNVRDRLKPFIAEN